MSNFLSPDNRLIGCQTVKNANKHVMRPYSPKMGEEITDIPERFEKSLYRWITRRNIVIDTYTAQARQ